MWWKFARAVRRGEHKLSLSTILTAITAVLYTVLPLDLIPELMLGPLGFIDDLGLWGVFVMLITREKQAWEASLPGAARVVTAEPV